MYFGNHKLSEKWGLHLEAQFRRHDFGVNWQQLLLRTGINYYANANTTLTAGYCFVNTYPYGEFPVKATFPENRIWEQVQLKNQNGRFEIINRYRLEQRFVNTPTLQDGVYKPGDAVYSNRFRPMTRVSIPFKGKEIVDKSFYVSVYDEIFVNFGKHVGYNILDQNRAYIAFGYRIPKLGRLEVGYLNQLVFKSDGIKVENNNTIQIGLSSSINFYKKKTQSN